MSEEQRCDAMALGKCRCTKERTHLFGDTAEERLHEHQIKPGDTLRWGIMSDLIETFGPLTDCGEDDG